MNKSLLIRKTKIVLKDNKHLLFLLFLWFFLGFAVYFFLLRLSFIESLKASFFLKHIENDFSSAYLMWSQGIVFGVIFTLIFQNIMQKYNPERGCRMIAKETKNHFVVVGFTHLGARLIKHFRDNKIPYCLIEKNKDAVDDLLRDGEPVIVDDAKEADALIDANVQTARAVIIASNNLETALLVTKRSREQNKDCMIITRCYHDEFAEIIDSLGASEVISSSRNAFDDILTRLKNLT